MYQCIIIQVLSETVSKALEQSGGGEASETAHFVSMVDKFFDCFNVSNFDSGKRKRKPFQDPYRSPDDNRLKVIIIIRTCPLLYLNFVVAQRGIFILL